MQPSPPRTLGRYELVEEIGRGATTIVYRARDPELDRVVVVKALAPQEGAPAGERAAFATRFLEEARRAAPVAHPSLVAIHDCGQDEASGTPFLVQEHVPGRTLAQALVPGERQRPDEALRLVAAVGRALQQLHAAGLVHRGVRPGNVLIPEGRPPKLADAGLAGIESARLGATDLRQAFAEPLYLSPEQAVGERVDARTDIFALGALAYRLVTGHDAFEADSAQQVLARVIHDRPRPPSRIVAGLPPGIDDVLGQALATARKDRYADIGAFCDDLDELMAGRPPRHVRQEGTRPERGPFLATAPGAEGGESNVTGALQKRRRSALRVAMAVLALGLVAGLELARRELEAPDAAPAGRPTLDPGRRGGPEPEELGLELPSLDALEPARISLDFRHTLERGTLVVTVDGSKVLERRVSAAVKRSLLGVKLREGRVRETIEVAPGRHEIAVGVYWGDDRRSERIAANFAAGSTRRLTAKVARVGKRLSVEWE